MPEGTFEQSPDASALFTAALDDPAQPAAAFDAVSVHADDAFAAFALSQHPDAVEAFTVSAQPDVAAVLALSAQPAFAAAWLAPSEETMTVDALLQHEAFSFFTFSLADNTRPEPARTKKPTITDKTTFLILC